MDALETLKALANDTRFTMLRMLHIRDLCVCELEVALEITQSKVSYHSFRFGKMDVGASMRSSRKLCITSAGWFRNRWPKRLTCRTFQIVAASRFHFRNNSV
jgi:DNA-binding transcriptional ArsR family regulator